MPLRYLLPLTLFALVPSPLATRTAERPRMRLVSALAPPDAGMTLARRRPSRTRAQFFESPLSAGLENLPAVRDWRASEGAQGLQQAKRQIEKVVGESLTTLRDDLLGEAVVLAMHLAPGDAPDQAHGLLLTRVRNRPLLDRVIHEFNAAQIHKGEVARVVVKDWRGTAYSARVYHDPRRPTEFYASLDQTFAWSNSEELVQGVIDRKAGTRPASLDEPKFQRVRGKLPTHAAIQPVPGRRIPQACPGSGRLGRKNAVGRARIIACRPGALTSTAVEYAGAALEWRDGLVLHTEETIQPDRLDPWLRRWAAATPEKTAKAVLSGTCPATALAMGSLYLDFPAVFQAIESVVPDEGRTKFGNSLEALKGVLLGRDVRTELLPVPWAGRSWRTSRPLTGRFGPEEHGFPFVVTVERRR